LPANIKVTAKNRGMTLVEILVSLLLFGILATVTASILLGSLRNYSKAQVSREIRYQTHSALQTIVTDINRGILLPSIGTANTWIPSSILSPNPYGVMNGDHDPGNGIADNYLAISISSGSIQAPFLTGSLSNYQIIQYIVPASAPNQLRRRVYYNLGTAVNGYVGFSLNSARYWLLSHDQLSSNHLLREDILVKLPDESDRVVLKVSRPEMTLSEKTGNPYGLNYSPNVINVNIQAIRSNPGGQPVVVYNEQTNARAMTRF
jgi:prepilin-type N-terminal cleavage/methylation domain-containing protein